MTPSEFEKLPAIRDLLIENEENLIKDFARDQILEKLIDKYNILEIVVEYPRIADFINELFKELK